METSGISIEIILNSLPIGDMLDLHLIGLILVISYDKYN